MQIFKGISAILLCASALATEPLQDQFESFDLKGTIFSEASLSMPVPQSSILLTRRREDRCSAMGGPVGVFSLRDGALWLVRFRSCGSDEIPLSEIYPDTHDAIKAEWLNGIFTVLAGKQCVEAGGKLRHEKTIKIRIKHGNVENMAVKADDILHCGSTIN
ncbi:hypothetical protein KSF73_14185 [Burkholderiaceae bacterium DAT-1]|nr:hypothetical protein [Burkholderiaceae bacterium DAT-1]